MPTLRTRPSRQIEEFFIPTERKSSLRSQTYPSATTTAKRLSSVLCIDSDTTYQKESPSRKREKVFDTDSDESEPEIHPSPTKRAKADKARLSYPSPPSDKGEIRKAPSAETDAMSGTMLLDLPLEVSTNALKLPISPTQHLSHLGRHHSLLP